MNTTNSDTTNGTAIDRAARERTALLAATAPDDGDLARLRERLTRDAEAGGVLDLAYTETDTPVGRMLLAATERGLVRVAFEIEGLDGVLERLAASLSPRILHAPRRLDEARRELDEYFARERMTFDLPLDRALSRGFRRTVQEHLPDIRYGTTESYSEVARIVGSPQAVRAVGTACATNPLPIVVPCHRVLRADGTIGQYVGGTAVKAALLELEAAA